MTIKQIDIDTYSQLVLKCNNTAFVQLANWGKFKEETNWNQELLGFEVNGDIIGCAQVLYKQVSRTKYNLAYIAGGYTLLDDSYEVDVNTELEKYLKRKKSIALKIDPQLPYKISKDHSEVVDLTDGNNLIEHYQSLGYKHLGFLNEFEGMQPRHTFHINTTEDYQTTFKKMSKHTQRNIKTSRKYKSSQIIVADLELLPEFYNLLSETAARDKFSIRNYEYFEKMLEIAGSNVRLTLLRVDLNELEVEISEQNQKLERDYQKLANKEKTAKPNNNQLDNLQTQIDVNNSRLEEINSKRAADGEICYLAGNLSIDDQKNSWYLFGASSSDLRFLRPPYLLMDDMIKYAIDHNFGYYDMYGVSGIFEKDHPDYGLYTYKSGFGGNLVEFIGEFDKPLNKLLYFGFETVYPKLKKMRKKKARR